MSHHPSCVPDLSFVISFRDNEDQIGHQVRAIAAHAAAMGLGFEILAVNDGSRDNSLSVLELVGARIPELRILRAAIEQHDRSAAVRELPGPHFLIGVSFDAPSLHSQRILIDCNDFAVCQNLFHFR